MKYILVCGKTEKITVTGPIFGPTELDFRGYFRMIQYKVKELWFCQKLTVRVCDTMMVYGWITDIWDL